MSSLTTTSLPEQPGPDHAGSGEREHRTQISAGIILLLATACGLMAANLYYAQPLLAPISASLGMSTSSAGLIVMLTQIGYGAGLLFIVPLADLTENRRLVLILIGICAAALAAACVAPDAAAFLGAALMIGIGSVAIQILVPYAAHLSPPENRGQAVGKVMSGLLLGIMLARPVASLMDHVWRWRGIFGISSVIMLVLGVVLWRALPRREPQSGMRYADLLASMVQIVRGTEILRRRALYHATLFGAFSMFWTTAPLRLASPEFGLSQAGIALFALAGVAGATAAPVAGWLADRGWSRPVTGAALLIGCTAFVLSGLDHSGSPRALGLFVASAILLDVAVSANLVVGQRAIFALGAGLRSRLNGLYMAAFFAGGAIGSAIGAWLYTWGSWGAVAWVGIAMPAVALMYFATEFRSR